MSRGSCSRSPRPQACSSPPDPRWSRCGWTSSRQRTGGTPPPWKWSCRSPPRTGRGSALRRGSSSSCAGVARPSSGCRGRWRSTATDGCGWKPCGRRVPTSSTWRSAAPAGTPAACGRIGSRCRRSVPPPSRHRHRSPRPARAHPRLQPRHPRSTPSRRPHQLHPWSRPRPPLQNPTRSRHRPPPRGRPRLIRPPLPRRRQSRWRPPSPPRSPQPPRSQPSPQPSRPQPLRQRRSSWPPRRLLHREPRRRPPGRPATPSR